MRKYLLLLLISTITITIFAQPLIDDLELENSVIQVNYQKKSARLAVVMSAILPGAGSVYVSPKRWVGYIFPIIEGALLYGYISYRQDATDQERAYEKYVNEEIITLTDPISGNIIYEGTRYNREFQDLVQTFVSDVNTGDIYDCDDNESGGQNYFFRLDEKNSQHFYEDVGKYNKYIYGWVDWYEKYAYNGQGNLNDGYSDPIINWSSDANDANHTILNYTLQPYEGNEEDQYQGLNTPMRAKYIQMRRDAQEKYDSSNLFIYGMLLNRVVSAVDAGLAVKKYNKNYISQNNFQFNYAATTKNDRFTPMVFLTQRF
jgi:hypothetical protein